MHSIAKYFVDEPTLTAHLQAKKDFMLARASTSPALGELLRLKNIDASPSTLANLISGKATAPTLGSLRTAASANGLDLIGIKAHQARQLPTPFIAHMREGAFALVTGIEGDTINVWNEGGSPQHLAPEEFATKWSGYALVEREALNLDALPNDTRPAPNTTIARAD